MRWFLATFLMVFAWPAVGDEMTAVQAGLEPVARLNGKWHGVGHGRWGESSAEIEFGWTLDGHFIHGRGRSVYPRQERNPDGEIHDFISFYSYDTNRGTIVLRELDNEGFASTYYLDESSSTDNELVFVAEYMENVPAGWKARLTLIFRADTEYHERFELDTDGAGYKEYLTTRYLRVSE